mgnify:FL=1
MWLGWEVGVGVGDGDGDVDGLWGGVEEWARLQGLGWTPTLLLNIGTRDWGRRGGGGVVKGSEEYCSVLLEVL